MSPNPVFIILGAGGFPFRVSAAGNKYHFMSKALMACNFSVLLLNKYNISDAKCESEGIFNGIKFSYLSGASKRDTILSKIIGEILANIRLVSFLRKQKNRVNRNYLMISYTPIYLVFYYWVLTRIFHYKMIISIMEYHPSLARGIFKKIATEIFWRIGLLLADGVVPISTYLQEQVRKRSKSTPIFKIPVLADYNKELYKKTKGCNKYFLYCGSIGYSEVIELIINAFSRLSNDNVHLYLILHGDKQMIDVFINKIRNKRIVIYNSIPQDDLYYYYANSIGLLIPLRPIIRDTARFPQKIAEYLASGSPLITNEVGEIKSYFQDGVNAIFAEEYSVDAYKKAMQYVLGNSEISRNIGERGREMGNKHFHYENISLDFSNYLMSI